MSSDSPIYCPICGENCSDSKNTFSKAKLSSGGSIFQCFLKLFCSNWKGKSFSFCEQCRTHLVLIAELKTELQKLELRLNSKEDELKDKFFCSEETFESRGLYVRDTRYRRLRKQIFGVEGKQLKPESPKEFPDEDGAFSFSNSNSNCDQFPEESLALPVNSGFKVEYIMVEKEEEEEEDFNPIINVKSIDKDSNHNFEEEYEQLTDLKEEDQINPLEEFEIKVESESEFELSSADEAEEDDGDDAHDEDYVKSSSEDPDNEDEMGEDEDEMEKDEDLEIVEIEKEAKRKLQSKGIEVMSSQNTLNLNEAKPKHDDNDYPFMTYRGFRLYRVSETHYKCSQCSLLLPNRKRHLRTHIVREHTNLYACPHCPKRFGWGYNLRRHIDASHKKISFGECPICARPFNWVGPRDSHIWTHYSDQDKAEAIARGERLPSAFREKYKCSKCQQRFIRKSHLDKHFKAIHVPKELQQKEKSLCGICGVWVMDLYQHKTYKHAAPEELKFGCNICHKKFSRGSILRTHKRRAHAQGRPWKCEECGRSFRFQAQMKEHQWVHESVKPFQCQVCGKQFTRRDVMRRHMKDVHKVEDKSEVLIIRKEPENEEEGKLPAIKIRKDSSEDSKEEDSSFQKQKGIFVPTTSEVKRGGFQRTREIGENFIAYHDVRLYHVSGNEYKCSQCELIFKNKGNLLRSHVIKEHTNLNVCPYCQSRFDRASKLKRHVEKTHKKIIVGICPVCARPYTCENALAKHIWTHKSEEEKKQAEAQEGKLRPNPKKFRCEVENCEGAFINRVALAKHFKAIHTEEKEEKEKHLCGICGKVVQDLKLHMIVKHTPEEEKKFECNLCPKKFSMEKLLRDHKKKAHANGKPWKCKVCGRDFKFEKYLKEHEVGHEDVKPFKCHLCEMGFTRKHVLNRHLENIHEKKNRGDKI